MGARQTQIESRTRGARRARSERGHARRAWVGALGATGTLALLAVQAQAERPAGRAVDQADALTRRIDSALEARWQAASLTPAAPTSDLELLRRLSLDLLGTIPSLEEIRTLEAEPEAGRRIRLVERVLADERFQEVLAERLARTVVGAGKKKGDLFYRRRRFVEWLEDQLKKHRPWDELVREIVAAEGVTSDGPANFIVASDADPAKLASRTARGFLGVRLDCAQCHDHPFADWKQRDFEGLEAFYARVSRKGPLVREARTGELTKDDRKSSPQGMMGGGGRTVAPAVPCAREALPAAGTGPRRAALGRWITDARNPFFARAIANRLWAWLLGRGIIENVDEIDEGKPRFPEVLDALEQDLRTNGFDLARLVRAIVGTRAYALASRLPGSRAGEEARLQDACALFPLKPLHPDQLANAVWQATSVETQDASRSLVVRLARFDATQKFVARHGGDLDSESPEDQTLLQRLLLLNGNLIQDRIRARNPLGATPRLVLLASTDRALVETAYLVVLGRRPSPEESAHFEGRLAGKKLGERAKTAEDLLWALLNSTELAWNH